MFGARTAQDERWALMMGGGGHVGMAFKLIVFGGAPAASRTVSWLITPPNPNLGGSSAGDNPPGDGRGNGPLCFDPVPPISRFYLLDHQDLGSRFPLERTPNQSCQTGDFPQDPVAGPAGFRQLIRMPQHLPLRSRAGHILGGGHQLEELISLQSEHGGTVPKAGFRTMVTASQSLSQLFSS